jgi:TolB-like protein
MLLERPGALLSREELRRRLWPDGTIVDFEHSLNAAVKRLRASLGDDAENPGFVATVPRRGYRFIGRLETGDIGRVSRPAPRLAVLPFSHLSERGSSEYFTDGLTEETIAQLGQRCRGRIGVIARCSSMAFKGSTQPVRTIGEALRVPYLLEGGVRRDGDRVRVSASLVDTASETHLWSETYERYLIDYLDVQSDIAGRIADSLTWHLSRRIRRVAGGVLPVQGPGRSPGPVTVTDAAGRPHRSAVLGPTLAASSPTNRGRLLDGRPGQSDAD